MASNRTGINSDDVSATSSATNSNSWSTPFNVIASYDIPIDRKVTEEIMEILELECIDEKDQIIFDVLRNGRQTLVKYQEVLTPEVYSAEINDFDENSGTATEELRETPLLKLIKQHVYQQWEAGCKNQSTIWKFINKIKDESNDHFEEILTHAAEYGTTYTKSYSILAVILQLLFQGIDDKCLKDKSVFIDLYESVTMKGSQGCKDFTEYISPEDLQEQVDDPNSPLFLTLRMFYQEKIPQLFKEHKISNTKDDLYNLAVDNVIKNGWLKGIELVKRKIPPIKYAPLFQAITTMFATYSESVPTIISTPDPASIPLSSFGNVIINEKEKKQLYTEDLRRDLRQDLLNMPSCAEKSIMELLVYFLDKLAENRMSSQEDAIVTSLLQELQNQIEKQELFSEKIQTNFQDLGRCLDRHDLLSAVNCLGELLKKIRPLNLQEIRRLLEKAEKAGQLICGKEIILLIGETGTGKSTTIQFLAGCKMQKIQEEVEHGRYLDHITADGSFTNPELKNVTTSPRSKAETRYITPVTVQLKDIFGPHESGQIILCDAPGFGDTAGPEVDIANSVGVIKALKSCKSVKIFALSSYQGLGDRGQGIQKLAHLLVNLLNDIHGRCNCIFYGFTKYPSHDDIYARLLDIKQSKVETDPLLQLDSAFVTVLTDMIEKTREQAEKIDPINGDRKKIIKNLKSIDSINYPEEAFQFSVSAETQACIENQVQRDVSSVQCALKHKDTNLMKYYLDNLKILKDLLKHSAVRDAYKSAIRSVSESIMDYYNEVIKNFNCSLNSQDGLEKEDIDAYKDCIKYIQQIQILNEHIRSNVISSESLTQNIRSELQKINQNLIKESLYNRSIEIYLNNLCMLKDSFKELELLYNTSCKSFEERFKELVQLARKTISSDDFNDTAEIIRQILKCLSVLDSHLNGIVEINYKEIVQYLLQHLNGLSDKVDSILGKNRLSDKDIEIIRDCIETLKSAKNNTALEARVLTYIEILKKKSDKLPENVTDLNTIYNILIGKISDYFDQINKRITKSLEANNDNTFVDLEELVNVMDTIRVIPEIESQTAAAYYNTMVNIREHTRQVEEDIKELLFYTDHQSGTINCRKISQLLSRLKNAKWMDRISHGACDIAINHITEELFDYFHQLEDDLIRLQLDWRHPENIPKAQEILKKVESFSPLERSIQELKNRKDAIVQHFLETIQRNHRLILTIFNLQDNNTYQTEQDLRHYEEIKREYDNLHPAQIVLENSGFSDINKLNNEINELEKSLEIELQPETEKRSKIELKLNDLKLVNQNQKYQDEREKTQTDKSSKSVDNSAIDTVCSIQKSFDHQLEVIQQIETKYNNSLSPLKSVKQQYELSLKILDSISLEQTKLLKENGLDSIESLVEIIGKKKRAFSETQKNELSSDFNGRLNASAAEKALEYVINCQNISNVNIKNIADDIYDQLEKYISNYGESLQEKIDNSFKRWTTVDDAVNSLKYSYELETSLKQFDSLSKFTRVYEFIEGVKKKENLCEKFNKQYQEMSYFMEQCKDEGRYRDLRNLVTIAQGLISLDKFCDDNTTSINFETLYKAYRTELAAETRSQDSVVQDYISREEYSQANMILAEFDDRALNSKYGENIRYNLHQSLNNIMQKVRDAVLEIDRKINFDDENKKRIEEMKKNMETIRTVLMQSRIMKLIPEKTQSDLRNFEESTKTLLSSILLKSLNHIEEFINNDDAFEAEEAMKNFNNLQQEIVNFVNDNTLQKAKDVRKKLSSLSDDISKDNNFKDNKTYSRKPPAILLPKLEKAKSIKEAYSFCWESIVHDINEYFETQINIAKEVLIEKRVEYIQQLNSLMKFLPEDLKTKYRLQINKLSHKFIEEEKVYKYELRKFLENENVVDSDMKQIDKLVLEFKQENRGELLGILQNKITENLSKLWNSAKNAINNNDIQSAINYMKQIIKFKENIENILEIDEYYKRVCNLTNTNITSCAETLTDIFKIERTEIVEHAFHNMIAYIEFGQEFPDKINDLLPETIMKNVIISLQNHFDNWTTFSFTFNIAMKELNIKSLHEITNTMKQWDGFLKKIRTCISRDKSIEKFLNIAKNIKLYSEMIDEINELITFLKDNLSVDLINDEMAQSETERNQFFHKLGMYLKALKLINSEFKNNLVTEIDIVKIETKLEEKIEDIKQKLLEYASKDQFLFFESDYFRLYHHYLVSCHKYLNLPQTKIRDTIISAESKILQKVTVLSNKIERAETNISEVAQLLMDMKFFAENFSMLESQINKVIDDVLKSYKTKYGTSTFSHLIMNLEKSDEGARFLAENMKLKAEDQRNRREKMQYQDDLQYFLNGLVEDDLDKDGIKTRYEKFKSKYEECIKNILSSFNSKTEEEPNVKPIISAAKALVGTMKQKRVEITWDHSFRDRVLELIAYIFAIWTLKNTQSYNETRGIKEAQAYLLIPHVGQVISLFRIFGIGYKQNSRFSSITAPFTRKSLNDFVNNLVEIGTGEGKSVVMAVSACIFALVGIDVYCSCYSEYLSMRDRNDFASVFQALGIEKYIQYGTFNTLCESFLNEQCNVREKVLDMIMNNKDTIDVSETKTTARQKVLLIDEVDVFLNAKYYGETYTPSVYLKEPSINTLLDTLWKDRNIRTLIAVKALPAYKNCATRFSNWMFLFDEAIKDMIAALQSFPSSTYMVQNDRIVYVEGESFAENVVRGYDTIWAYYFENQKGFISEQSLKTNTGIIITCGTFSYAEIPHEFTYITGVTGTLKTLAQPEKDILKNVYRIQRNTYMPSVFGKSNRIYNPLNDVQTVDKSEYFMKIQGEIDMIRNAERAILVFFESEEKLLAFYKSKELSSIKQEVQIISEKVSSKDRELCVKRATTKGRVTLLTRIFGRGTDLICRNQQVLANGGIHVLQTFFSEELSEEYQIMGRGARQGDRGSYRMILLDSDLEWVLGPDWEHKIPTITGHKFYTILNEHRNKLYESKSASKEIGVKYCKHEHQSSRIFMNALSEGKIDIIKNFLTEQNRGANIDCGSSRTVLLIDATGSMSNLLSATKDTVCTMFERASAVLEEKGLPKDVFSMQIAVYRNYNSEDNKILEVSAWETKASNLRTFINSIGPEGGWGNEAIEIGLWHAYKESETQDSISQIILIGDAPANSQYDVATKREKLGENYWKQTRYATPTHYEIELQKLKEKNIPVHAFYLTDPAKDDFEKIAIETKGRCELLNISSIEGVESLTNFVTEEVLRKAAGSDGDSAVLLYRAKYIKRSFMQ